MSCGAKTNDAGTGERIYTLDVSTYFGFPPSFYKHHWEKNSFSLLLRRKPRKSHAVRMGHAQKILSPTLRWNVNIPLEMECCVVPSRSQKYFTFFSISGLIGCFPEKLHKFEKIYDSSSYVCTEARNRGSGLQFRKYFFLIFVVLLVL